MSRIQSEGSRPGFGALTAPWLRWGLALAVLGGSMSCDEGTPVGTDADYSLSLAPAALTVQQGTNGNSTVTISRSDFTGAVTLSLGGAPAGVTGAFVPPDPTGNSSTLTVTVGAAVAPGVYNLTVNGSGTPGSRSTPLTLTVAATPDYALSLLPAALTINQGANGNTAVTITRTNFTGAVTLSLGGAPAGVTGAFAPADPTGTTSTLTVTVGAAVAPGTYNLTVDGTATAGNHSTPLTLTVGAAPDYSLSLSPTALTIQEGANANTTVTLTRTNFTGAVTLSLGGAPAGVTGAFVPAAPTGGTSTLTVSVAAGVAAGTYNLTVDGAGAPGNRSTALTLTVTALPADYSLSLAPAAFTVAPGANGNTAVTIARTNFTGAVTLSLGGAPAGVTGAFAPAAPTGTTSTLTVTVGATVPEGVYNLTVDGTGTPGNRTTALTLTVAATPDYSLSVNPTSLTIEQNTNADATVTITRSNFTGAVTLSLGGAPAGVTGSFNPAAPTGTNSTLTLTVGAAVAPGVYNLTIDGTGTPGNRSTALTLTVTATPNYALSINPTSLSIDQGANANTAVTITRTNFTGAVTLSLGGAPAGVTGVFAPPAPTGTSATLTVTVGAAVAPGVYNLTVDGTGAPGSRSTPLTLTVTAAPDYALSINPTALSINQGANANTAVTIARTNFTGAVTLSLGSAPAGVTGVFVPAAPTGTSSTLTVAVGPAVAPGVYNLTVDGSGAPGSRSTPLTVTVSATPDYSLSINPSAGTLAQGDSGEIAVTIARTNFTGAVTLSLGGTVAGITGTFNPAAPTGTTSTLALKVGAAVPLGTYNLTVDGAGAPGARSTPLTLTVGSAGGGNVTVDFSACPAADRPLWLAYQDGAGAWTVVNEVGNVYQFNISSGTGGYAYVSSDAGATETSVRYLTQAQLTAGPINGCVLPPAGKTISGTGAGIAATDQARVSLGGGSAATSLAVPNFQLLNVASGAQDLVGYRHSMIGGADAAIIRRDLDIPDGGSVDTVDFAGAEAFAPGSALITVGGLAGGETVSATMRYQVGASCTSAALVPSILGGATFTAPGIVGAPQRPSDFHALTITAILGTSTIRSATESFHTLADRTVTLGAAMPTPTISSLGGPYTRLQAAYTLPADYNTSTFFGYDDGGNLSVTITATYGYLGGAATTLALPDFSALAGWNNSWAPATGSTGDWRTVGTGRNYSGSACAEGASLKTAIASGTY